MTALGGQVTRSGDELTMVSPSHRHDLTREIDIIEEVARVRGYETIEPQVPTVVMSDAEVPAAYGARERFRAQISFSRGGELDDHLSHVRRRRPPNVRTGRARSLARHWSIPYRSVHMAEDVRSGLVVHLTAKAVG